MLRLSILTLMSIVTFVAFCFAALRYSNDDWARITFAVVATFLVASILIAIAAKRNFRWFWLGFAIAGNWYFGVLLYHQYSDYDFDTEILLTDWILRLFAMVRNASDSMSYRIIGQLLWTVVIACIGGVFTLWVRKRWGDES